MIPRYIYLFIYSSASYLASDATNDCSDYLANKAIHTPSDASDARVQAIHYNILSAVVRDHERLFMATKMYMQRSM